MTPARVICDFETRSRKKLGKKDSVGAWRYAEDESTSILCLGYAIGEEPAKLWTPDQPFPQELVDHVNDGSLFEAHNVQFERAVWWYQLTLKLGIPSPQLWHDTMAVCAYRGLPLGLDEVGDVLELPVRKDKRGKHLISRLCQPVKPSKKWPDGWVNDPELFQELFDYCLQDVEAERVLSHVIGYLPESEYWIWRHYEEINARGLQIDVEAVDAARWIVTEVKRRLSAELVEITDGLVETGDKLPAIHAFLLKHDVRLPDLTKDTIIDALANYDMPDVCKRVLKLRQQLSSSTSKLEAFARCVMKDGRARGTQQYHGTAPGRTAGRLFQPTNMARWESKTLSMDGLIELIKSRDIEKLAEVHGDPLRGVADAQRGYIIAAPGKEFLVTDFSAIQAVATAWLAGEQWKLDAFAAIQRGEKYKGADDIYCYTASKILKRPVTKKEDPDGRQVGKKGELAFSFEGGLGAWRGFEEPGEYIYPDEEVHLFKNAWRAEHPATKRLWRELKTACAKAILNHGQVWQYKHIAFQTVDDATGRCLNMILPSSRRIWYFAPNVEVENTRYGIDYSITCEGRNNKKGGRWDVVYLYGGLLTENAAMGIERDLLSPAMQRMEGGGYPIVLTVYDEAVAEVPVGFGSQEEFDEFMRETPPWAAGMPIATAGWRGPRYRK